MTKCLLALALLLPVCARAIVVGNGARPAASPIVVPRTYELDAAGAASALRTLSSPSSLVASLPSALTLRLVDPETPAGRAALAPFAEALPLSGGDPLIAFLEASARLQQEADALVFQPIYIESDGPSALEDLARGMDAFGRNFGPYLSPAHQARLSLIAADLRAASAGRLMSSARRTADALGETRPDDAVAGSERRADERLPAARPGAEESRGEGVPAPRVPSPQPKKGFNAFNVVVYTGGGLVMAALGWFLFANLAPAGAGGVLAASVLFAAGLGGLGAWLHKRGQRVPAGVLFTAVVALVPVAVASLAGLVDAAAIGSAWTFRASAAATIAAAALLARKVRFAFLAMPAALAAWGLSIDAAVQIVDAGAWESWSGAMSAASALTGVALMAVARWIETKTKVDYPFWLYLAGLLAFSGGLALFPASGELGRFAYAMVHLGLVGAGLYLNRKTFAVFGYLGFNAWVLHLAWRFGETFGFAAGLGGAGLVLILSAVALKKYGAAFGAWLRGALKS